MPASKKRILYVDDDNDSCEMITVLLGTLGYEVIQAQDIAQAVAKAENNGLDLCLVDNLLPDGSGIELCGRIRSFNPHIPIVFYSGLARESDKEAAISAGAQVYLVKPTGLDLLEQTLSRLLDGADGAGRSAAPTRAGGHDSTRDVIKEMGQQWAERSKKRIERSRELAKEARERIDSSALKIEQTLSRYDSKKP